MAESKSHKMTANRIAGKQGVKYNSGKGADIQSSRATIEVETPGTVSSGVRQLQGYRGPVYIAGTDQKAVAAAQKRTQGTTIGVMDNQGKVVKNSTRKR